MILRKLVFILSVFCLVCCKIDGGNASRDFVLPRDTVIIQKADGTEYPFYVEMALNERHQQRGLMYRTNLPINTGMLFVFSKEQELTFWMKNTLIPLDMLFIADDGTIRHIHHMAKPQDLTSITSLEPASSVLEINGGLSDKYGIKEGDRIIHSIYRNDF